MRALVPGLTGQAAEKPGRLASTKHMGVDVEAVKGKVDFEYVGELTGIVVEVLNAANVDRAIKPVVFQDQEEAVFRQEGHPIDLKWDMAAIEWMERNIQGSPVILEGRTTQYQWGNRVSIYTGLPSILGWEWHQMQQRPESIYAITGRKSIVDSIYNTTSRSRASDLLKSYSVKYIVVGELERVRYAENGLAKFDEMVGKGLELAYENEQVKIYRVLPS